MAFFLCFSDHTSIGALADSFYEYLLKAWIYSGKKDYEARAMYDAAVKVINNEIGCGIDGEGD